MQVTVESSAGLERRLRVEIPEDRVKGEVDKRLHNIARQARVPGFRPGKVPMKVVMQRYGKQVREEVVGEMVQSSFRDAVVQEKLRPAGSPTIDPLEWEGGNGLAYTAVFDVLPEITLPPMDTVKVVRPQAEITDADVDGVIERLRHQRRTWREVSRPASSGDRVVIDFTGVCEGEARDDLAAEGFTIELGAGQVFQGMEEGLMGAEAGRDIDLDTAFPSNYGAGELAGKPVQFKIHVQKVEEAELPDANDELAAAFGVTEGGLEKLRAEVRANMEREAGDAVRKITKQRVLDALLAGRRIDLPESMVQREVERAMSQHLHELSHSGVDPSTVELDRGPFEEHARRRVSLGLLVAELIRENDLEADPEKVRQRIEIIASTYEQPREVLQWYYSDPARLSDVESTVLEDVVVDWILERADVSVERSSFDELWNPGQTTSVSGT